MSKKFSYLYYNAFFLSTLHSQLEIQTILFENLYSESFIHRFSYLKFVEGLVYNCIDYAQFLFE